MPDLTPHADRESNQDIWRILIVDDEDDVHKNALSALDNYIYDGKPVTLFSAYSVKQATSLLQQQPHFAVLFLNVVTETYDASLQLVRYVRETLKNHFARIILCADQPNCALEEVILRYEVNDYANKNELNRLKLLTLIIANLRAYSNLMLCESSKQSLEARVIELTQKLRKINEGFFTSVPYELQMCLSSIRNLAELISFFVEKAQPTEQDIQSVIDYSRIIKDCSEQLHEIFSNLFDIIRIEFDQTWVCISQLELRNITQSVINSHHPRAQQKGITIHLQAQETFYPVLGNEFVIRQILNDIISNAIKYSPFGKLVIIRLTQDEQRLQVEIQDEGPGLRVDQQHLFSKFSRLTPTPTGNKRSIGVDLFIVKKLVKEMKGEIWCDSQVGKGTTFTVTFLKPPMKVDVVVRASR